MILTLYPIKDTKIDNFNFYKGTSYEAIVIDVWHDEIDSRLDIIGAEVTGGILSRKIMAFTKKELHNKFIVVYNPSK